MSTQTHQTYNYLKHTQKLILHIHTVKSINRNVQYTHTHTHTYNIQYTVYKYYSVLGVTHYKSNTLQ